VSSTSVRPVPASVDQDTGASTAPDRLHHFFERSADARPDAVALVCESQDYTYEDLDVRANRLANYLLAAGLTPGSRVGILIERSLDLYVSLLAAMKSSATFVPIDPSAPADRVAYISEDSELSVIITTSASSPQCEQAPVWVVEVDELAAKIADAPRGRPRVVVGGDPICYILYTSGSTGRPKGVEIAQSSICNFISIVPEIYGVTPSERVYQGMVAAFDFSFEEIWPTWAVGATLVAGPTDGRRVGPGLAQFLEESAVTMIYCVPTVLATLDRTIPSIRTVNVGSSPAGVRAAVAS
jgi:non-ribosomal peptide synthetase component F